ncbi:hypothetical protein IT893_05135 [Thalassospira sp. A40-3]|nr:hypothetical protein [Thalassospira sp. A40-3]QPO12911.1 hypothetical protein IT893_05135 [Thalassospira sp. A40-3]
MSQRTKWLKWPRSGFARISVGAFRYGALQFAHNPNVNIKPIDRFPAAL